MPFGRDGLISAYQTLGWNPGRRARNAAPSGELQGTRSTSSREEEPGKIFHELRRGELARLGEVPHTPYYGSVDATPLFAFIFAETVKWTADRALWRELLPAAERALTWCDTYGDHDKRRVRRVRTSPAARCAVRGGRTRPNRSPIRTGSGRSFRPRSSRCRRTCTRAKMGVADLYEIDGDKTRADRLRGRRRELQTRFERDFWMEASSCYAQALDGDKKQVAGGDAQRGPCALVRDREPGARRRRHAAAHGADMYTGWGIRTLSERVYRRTTR